MIYTPTPVQIPAGVDMPLKKVLGVDCYFLVLVLSDCRVLAMSDRPHPYLRPPPGAYVAADGSIAMFSGKGFSNWTLSVDSATANSFLLDHPSARSYCLFMECLFLNFTFLFRLRPVVSRIYNACLTIHVLFTVNS
jgi:hypothetical protein